MLFKKSLLFKFSSVIVFLTGRRPALGMIRYLTTRKFPTVEWMTTKEFAQGLEDPSKPQPIILDARSEAEYAVSHLKNAERIDPNDPQLGVMKSKDMPIVVYCSVGYRSARIAAWLEQAGFTHVYNLEGSIFQWANEEE